MRKAIILVSGGLDSTTCLAIASKNFDCHTLAFDYGQKHKSELIAAKYISEFYGASVHKTFYLPLAQFGGSALTDHDLIIPDYHESEAIPSTYVPARNTVFLSIALAFAEVIGAFDIFIGVSAIDYSNYPDCRPAFMEQFQALADLATKTAIEDKKLTIHAPLIHLSKAETIQLGLSLGVDYSKTVSCYRADAEGRGCKQCDPCVLRRKGFEKCGVKDPTRYVISENIETSIYC